MSKKQAQRTGDDQNMNQRRTFLKQTGLGFGSLAMSGILVPQLHGQPLITPHNPPKAKRVIMVFLAGGMSQFETLDEKPLLSKRRGEQIPDSVRKGGVTSAITERQGNLAVVGSPFKFAKHGDCGMNISELFPHIAKHADDLTLIRTLQTDSVLHEAAVTTVFTGTPLLGRPSWGAWVSYALGSANKDLPEFTVLLSNGERLSPLHPRLWHSGFLKGRYQGVRLRGGKDPVLFVNNPPGVDAKSRAKVLESIAALNQIESDQTHDPRIATRMRAYELAGRMQNSVPDLADLKKEPKETLTRYGATPGKTSFANNCLLARRLAERDVRFIQVCDGGWDHHRDLPRNLPRKTKQIDQPIAALLSDLKERDMLKDTIVMVMGEFGRASVCEGGLTYDRYGRDHNGRIGSCLVAGGGFKGGLTYGTTDDWGWDVAENPVHINALQGTVLHQLGIDYQKLVTRHQGRDFRLTDVKGQVIKALLA